MRGELILAEMGEAVVGELHRQGVKETLRQYWLEEWQLVIRHGLDGKRDAKETVEILLELFALAWDMSDLAGKR